ncbi:hypothetical protein [Oenococcus sp.]
MRRDLVDFAFFKHTDDGRVYEKIQQAEHPSVNSPT